MLRKNIKIADLVDEVNRRNAASTCSPDVRTGWNVMLEGILMDADQYAGFGCLTSDELTDGAKDQGCDPGMVKIGDDPHDWTYPDESRRVYYMKRR